MNRKTTRAFIALTVAMLAFAFWPAAVPAAPAHLTAVREVAKRPANWAAVTPSSEPAKGAGIAASSLGPPAVAQLTCDQWLGPPYLNRFSESDSNGGCSNYFVESITLGQNGVPSSISVSGSADMEASITIPAGSTMTLAAGATVSCFTILYNPDGTIASFRACGSGIAVYGALNAGSSGGGSVVFTSGATSPAAGDWGGISFAPGSSGTLNSLQISYAGYYGPALGIGSAKVSGNSASDTLRIDHSLGDGVDIYGGAKLSINNATFSNITPPDSFTSVYALAVLDLQSLVTLSTATINNSSIRVSPDSAGMLSNLTFPGSGHVIQVLSGSLTKSATWQDFRVPYDMEGSLTVPGGLTLNIQPHATTPTIEFPSGSLAVEGTLNIPGTQTQPAVLTSDHATQAPGDWGGISFAQGSSGTLASVQISYGGNQACPALVCSAALIVNGASPSISNLTIDHSSADGLEVQGGGQPIINTATFSAIGPSTVYLSTYAIEVGDLQSFPTVSNATINGSSIRVAPDGIQNLSGLCFTEAGDTIHVLGGDTLQHDGAWPDFGSANCASVPYFLEGGLTVPPNTTLTIPPHATTPTVEFVGFEPLDVEGTLNIGDGSNRVLLTSGNPSPAAGDWGGISFAQNSAGALNLVQISYASYGVNIDGASPSLTNLTVDHSLYDGIYITGDAKPSIATAKFSAIASGPYASYYFAIDVNDLNSLPVISNLAVDSSSIRIPPNDINPATLSNLTFTGTGDTIHLTSVPLPVGSGPLSGNSTWPDFGVPYVLECHLIVPPGITLTIAHHATQPAIEFEDQSVIIVQGTLTMNGGAQAQPDVLTSFQSPPQPGNWIGITFQPGSNGNLAHVKISYAGEQDTACTSAVCFMAAVLIDGASPTFTDLNIDHSLGHGVEVLDGGAPSITTASFAAIGSAPNFTAYALDVEDLDSLPTLNTATIDPGGVRVAPDGVAKLTKLTFTGTGNTIHVLAGPVTASATWLNFGVPYVLEGSLTVQAGVSLTVKTDQPQSSTLMIEFQSGALDVGGALNAGSSTAPALQFTSAKSGPAAGDWDGLVFEPTSSGSFSNVQVSFAGAQFCQNSACTSAAILVDGSSPSFTSLTVDDSAGNGVEVRGGGVVSITAPNVATASSFYAIPTNFYAVEEDDLQSLVKLKEATINGAPIKVAPDGVNLLSNLTFQPTGASGGPIHVLGNGTLGASSTWSNFGVPYLLEGSLSVPAGTGLTFQPTPSTSEPQHFAGPLTVDVAGGASISIGGSFSTGNTPGFQPQPVILTSPGSAGAWQGLVFLPGSGGSPKFLQVQNAGGKNCAVTGASCFAAILVDGASPSFSNLTISNSAGNGVEVLNGGAPSIGTAGITNAYGQALFTVADSKPESVSYTATDTTNSLAPITITQTAAVTFFGPASASKSTVSANPASVVADGSSSSTITVTLLDANGNPVSGKAVSLTPGSGSSKVTGPSPALTDISGQTTFTVTDTTPEKVTYIAADTSESTTVTISQTAQVNFTAPSTSMPQGAASATAGSVSASASTVSASLALVPADGLTTSTITVNLVDASGNPVAGETVAVAADLGSSTITSATSGNSSFSGIASGFYALQVDDLISLPKLQSATISNSTARVAPDGVSKLSGLSFSGSAVIHVLGGAALTATATWPGLSVPYLLEGSLAVPPDLSLTIAPHSSTPTLLFTPGVGAAIVVSGTLTIPGTGSQPVALASGSATPTPGDWAGVDFRPGSSGMLTNVQFSDGGAGLCPSGSPPCYHTTILVEASSPTINGGSAFSQSSGNDVEIVGGGLPVLSTGDKFNAVPSGSFGVTNDGWTSGQKVNAACDDWGDPSGPSGAGTGTGTPVSTGVTFSPWACGAPTVTAISPTSGSVDGGTLVTITGTNFSTSPGGTTVQFGSVAAQIAACASCNTAATASSTSVACPSSTACYAVSPAGSGTVDVNVTVAHLTSAVNASDCATNTSPCDQFTYVGVADASKSKLAAAPASVPADGATTVMLTVTLLDTQQTPVAGKTVTLSAGAGSHAIISAASGPSNSKGLVTFTAKDSTVETVTFSATDTTDSVLLTQMAPVDFTRSSTAAAGVSIRPGTARVTPSGNVSVTLQAQAPTAGLGAWDVHVVYDPTVLQVSAGGCVSSVSSACNPGFASSTIDIAGSAVSPGLTGSQALATLTFQAIGAAGSSSALTPSIVTFKDASGNAVPSPTSANGLVFAGAQGDVNLDGAVNATDALCVLRDVAGLSATAACPENGATLAAADVNGDGSVTSVDALCVLRIVAALGSTAACTPPSSSASAGAARTPSASASASTVAAHVSLTPNTVARDSGRTTPVEVAADVAGAGLGAWTLDVSYDPTALKVLSCKPADGSTCNVSYKLGVARISGASSSGLTGNATLATLEVESSGKSGSGELKLTVVTLADPTGARLSVAPASGDSRPQPGSDTPAAGRQEP